jgi:hypothetical protein
MNTTPESVTSDWSPAMSPNQSIQGSYQLLEDEHIVRISNPQMGDYPKVAGPTYL